MSEVPDQSQAFPTNLKSILWVSVLTLLSFPILVEQWWWNVALTHQADESEVFRIVSTLLFSGALLAFLIFAESQKRVILLLIAIFVSVALITEIIQTGRLVAVISIIVFLSILFEAIRQNLPLFRDLKSDGVSILRVAGRSAFLWCPMILVIGLGYLGNVYLLTAFENVVYSATPVDRYCETAGAENETILPCTSLGEVLRQSDIVELTPADAIEAQIRNRFLDTRASFINNIESTTFSGAEGLRQLAYQLSGALNLQSILVSFPQQTLVNRKITQDKKIAEFWDQVRSVPHQHQADAVRAQLNEYTRQLTAGLVAEIDDDQGEQLKEVSNLFLTYLTISNLPKLEVDGRPLIDVTDKAQVDAEIGKLQFDVMVELDRLEDGALRSAKQYFDLVRAASEGTDDAPISVSAVLSKTLVPDADNSFFIENFPFPKNVSSQYFEAVDRAIVGIANDRSRASSLLGGYGLCQTTKLSEGVYEGSEIEDKSSSLDPKLAIVNRVPFRCPDAIPEEGIPLKPIGIERSAKFSVMTFQRDQAIALDQSFRALVRDAHKLSNESKSEALQSINSVKGFLAQTAENLH